MTDTDPLAEASEPAAEEEPTEDLAAQHRAFKVRAAEAFHRAADEANWCDDFDRVMSRVGLPPRERYRRLDRYGQDLTLETLRGEETAEEFDAWRRGTARALYAQLRDYGLHDERHRTRLTELGFPALERRDVIIEGRFSVPLQVEALAGDDLITGVDSVTAYQQVAHHWNTDAVTWKVVVPGAETDEVEPTNDAGGGEG